MLQCCHDKSCACGRGLPVIEEIQGRSTDFVVAADGTVMHGLALIYTLRDITGMKAFKIIQETLELTRVLIVPGANLQCSGGHCAHRTRFSRPPW